MAKKKKKQEQPHREVTRRQLAKWQYQKKRQRIIFSIGVTIIAAVILIVLAGWYIGEFRPMRQTVIRVNDTEFNMKYYVDVLEIAGIGQPPEILDYVADSTIREIERNELIRQGALKLEISVSDDEVKEKLKEFEVPNTAVNRDLLGVQLLVEKLRNGYFDQQVPQATRQRHVMAMLLESESQAAEVKGRLENGESFTELAGELSLNFFSKAMEGDYGWHPESIFRDLFSTNTTLDYVLSARVGELSQPLYDEEIIKGVSYWLMKVLDRDEEMEEVHVHAMLLGSEEETQEVKAKLEAGESFAALAKELSSLSNAEGNEGDLGMVARGELPTAPDEFAFNDEIELGTLSEPIRDDMASTKSGYWIIKVLDEDNNRQLEEEDREILKDRAFNEWITSLWDDPDNEIDDSYLDATRKTWAIQRLM